MVEEHAVWQNEANTPTGPLLARPLPNECDSKLTICERRVMILAPLFSASDGSIETLPGRVANNEIELSEAFT
jgi:hypothetical protein